MLLLLATLLAATAAYCLLHWLLVLYTFMYVCMRDGLLLLAMHVPERLVVTCYLLWSFLTKWKTCQET